MFVNADSSRGVVYYDIIKESLPRVLAPRFGNRWDPWQNYLPSRLARAKHCFDWWSEGAPDRT